MIRESDIQAACRSLGFALSGVCAVGPSGRSSEFHAWLEAGKHGTMEYLARNTHIRNDPGSLLAGARSAIMVADLYRARTANDRAEKSGNGAPPTSGRIARYAQGRDYHKVMKKRLHDLCDSLRAQHPTAEFRAFVDTAPLMEREIAFLAGLGWIGKHTLLIHPRIGSYFFLGGILTTLEIPPVTAPLTDHCGTCTRCIDACPTNAITPYSVDASRCISYLTIENRGPIDERFHDAIGNWLYGCDICQDVCPHNSPRPSDADVGERNPEYAPRRDSFDVLEVLNWTAEDRTTALAGSAMTRATLEMFKRNAVVVAANSIRRGCPEPLRSTIVSRLKELASDPSAPSQLSALSASVLRSLPAE